jgi:hypothetical protein
MMGIDVHSLSKREEVDTFNPKLLPPRTGYNFKFAHLYKLGKKAEKTHQNVHE